nr:MAG: ORF2 [Torque teno polar bear virus 44]
MWSGSSTPDDIEKQVQCDQWLVMVVSSHRLWCHCPDYRVHIPGWPGTGVVAASGAAAGGPGGDGGSAATDAGGPTDADMVAVSFDLGEPLDIGEDSR